MHKKIKLLIWISLFSAALLAPSTVQAEGVEIDTAALQQYIKNDRAKIQQTASGKFLRAHSTPDALFSKSGAIFSPVNSGDSWNVKFSVVNF